MKKSFDSHHHVKSHQLAVGDCVRVKQPDKSHKLGQAFSQPLTVVQVKGDICVLSDGKSWHVNRLVKSTLSSGMQADQPSQREPTTDNSKRPVRGTRGTIPVRLADYHVGCIN